MLYGGDSLILGRHRTARRDQCFSRGVGHQMQMEIATSHIDLSCDPLNPGAVDSGG